MMICVSSVNYTIVVGIAAASAILLAVAGIWSIRESNIFPGSSGTGNQNLYRFGVTCTVAAVISALTIAYLYFFKHKQYEMPGFKFLESFNQV
jgi:hypothetical protein